MLKNFFTVAFRNFRKQKGLSIINVAGLAIGISASLVIYLIVQHEFSYDKHHEGGDRIYRVVSSITFSDVSFDNSGVPVPTYQAVRNDATGLEESTHFIVANDPKVTVPTPGTLTPPSFKNQKQIIFADDHYFKLIKYNWLAGSEQTALADPYQVVLTLSRAKTYFASLEPKDMIGREIIYQDSIKTTVSGVVDDLKQITDFRFKEFISRETIAKTNLKKNHAWDEWNNINSNSQMLVKLNKGITPNQVEAQLVNIREKYRQREGDKAESDKDDIKQTLQPLADIHFNSKYDAFGGHMAHRPTLFGLLAVAACLLLLGCINFINLTTASAAQRGKEIGIRKTLGSGKRQLVAQFLTETAWLTLLATLLSIAITPWLLNVFKDFMPEGVSFGSLSQWNVWLFLGLLLVVVTVSAGFYPALVLTRFKPVTVLKNQSAGNSAQSRKAWLRKTLTVTQFLIAQFLIIATFVVSKQINYSLNKDLGFSRDAIVSFRVRFNYNDAEKATSRLVLFQKLKEIPGIEKLSLSGSEPASNGTSSTTMKYQLGDKTTETMVEIKKADSNYFDLYKMKLIAGRNLQQSDTTREFVINETFAKLMGYKKPEQALGQYLESNSKKIQIVGVLRDFHTKSTHVAIKPLAYSSALKESYMFHLALKPQGEKADNWKHTLAKVEKSFKEIYPEDDFKYNFFDEQIAAFYKSEQQINRLLKWAAGLCIFISCLGLLGLAVFITNSRTKEIGVRKVLGASVLQIVTLLSRDFILLVLVAFAVAVPLSWWVMHRWLDDFVYRTEMSWWIFTVTGVGMIVIALLVLSLRTIRSALVNPIKSLRTE